MLIRSLIHGVGMLLLVAVVCECASAAEFQKFYFVGEVKLSTPTGASAGSQVILFEKTHDPANSTMVESAVVVHADGKVEEHTMRAVVTGNTFTIADDAKTISGSGTLSGPEWKWTYFKATYKSTNGAQIEDENFMADDSVITARKKIMAPDGKIVLYMDMTLKAITPTTFEILKTGLLRKKN